MALFEAGPSGSSGGGSGGNSQVVTFAPFTRPALSSFTWDNQQSATATDHANGPLTINNAASTDNNIHGLGMVIPGSTPWTLTAQLQNCSVAGTSSSFPASGIYLSDGTGFEMWHVGLATNVEDGQVLAVEFWSNATTYGSSVFNSFLACPNPWLRIHNSGTVYSFQVSPNGADWLTVYATNALNLNNPVTRAGFMVLNSSLYGGIAALANWELTTGAGSNATFQAAY